MANKKLSALTAFSTLATGDYVPVVDISDTTDAASGTTKRAVLSDVATALAGFIDVLVYKGATDCSANPNYPAADAGHIYLVSVAGKIGGASGVVVEAGDMFVCKTDGTSSGTQAGVGANWNILQTNITFTPGTGDVVGPGSSTDNAVARFDSTTGKMIQDSSMTCADDLSGEIGYINIPQNSQSADYTAVIADRGKHIYHPTSDNNARTFTIPANGSVAFPIGTAITFINDKNTVTIAITTDTLVWADDGSTGSRTLAENGMATAIKVTSTRWLISGTGLS